MFEKATLFSAIVVFIAFGIVGIKMFNYFAAKNQITKTSMNYDRVLTNNFF